MRTRGRSGRWCFWHRQQDGTWQERREARGGGAPPWYAPAKYRIWETGCVAGYCTILGHRSFWADAADYVRKAWRGMEDSGTLHPHIATMLLLGPSTREDDKGLVRSCRNAIERYLAVREPDPYDSILLAETMLACYIDLDDPIIEELARSITQFQHADGGIITGYGEHLRVEATLHAALFFGSLSQL